MDIIHIKTRMTRLSLSQERLARIIGMHPSLLTRYFRGDRPSPVGFKARINAALDKLEAAEKAASEARERVLAGGRP